MGQIIGGISRSRLLHPDFFSESGVSAVYWHSTLRSTNDAARKLADEGAPDRSLVITPNQTAGRGRGVNRWWSGRESLTFSVILRPPHTKSVPPDSAPLALVAGMAVVRAIRGMDARCHAGVKWPNDIISADMKKIGGILVESVHRQGRLSTAVIGVGLNINTSLRNAPAAIRRRSTSLKRMTGRAWNAYVLLCAILAELWPYSDLFFLNGFASFKQEWGGFDNVPRGRAVSIEEAGRRTPGVYEGLRADGSLILRIASGEARAVRSGTLVADG